MVSDYTCGCKPDLENVAHVVVSSVEQYVEKYLDEQSRGSSFLESLTVKDILEGILMNQVFPYAFIMYKLIFQMMF